MEKIEVTLPIALKVWWSFTWRSLLLVFLGTMVLSIVAVFILEIFALSKETITTFVGIFAFVVSIPLQGYVMKKVLNKKYKTFSIVLIREQ